MVSKVLFKTDFQKNKDWNFVLYLQELYFYQV